jgi:hypothetical protein
MTSTTRGVSSEVKKKRLKHALKPSRHQRALMRQEHRHEVELDLLYRLITGMLVKTETGEVYLGQTDISARDLGYRFVVDQDQDAVRVKLLEPPEGDEVVYLKDEPSQESTEVQSPTEGFDPYEYLLHMEELKSDGVVDFEALGPPIIAVQTEDGFVAMGEDGELVKL